MFGLSAGRSYDISRMKQILRLEQTIPLNACDLNSLRELRSRVYSVRGSIYSMNVL